MLTVVAPVRSCGGAQLRDAGISDLASVVAFSTTDQPEFEGGWYRDSYARPAFSERLKRRYSSERLANHMVSYAYDSSWWVRGGVEPDRVDAR